MGYKINGIEVSKEILNNYFDSLVNKIFAILLPITFPIEISKCPFIVDVKLTINSGNDVPIATIVNPITSSEI